MISDSHKFICFRIGKNASSSLRRSLKSYCSREIHIRLGVIDVMGNLEKRGLNKEKWDTYFKFAFVRNPFDRLVSRYFYGIEHNTELHNSRFCKSDETPEDFLEFVKNYSSYIGRNSIYQYDRLCDKNGIIQMDFVGKVENFQSDINTICQKLKIPPFNISYINKSKKRKKNYRKYYLSETVEFVKETWRKDIEFFNYKF